MVKKLFAILFFSGLGFVVGFIAGFVFSDIRRNNAE